MRLDRERRPVVILERHVLVAPRRIGRASAQINPSVDRSRFKELRDLYTLAVCAALA
jgi:hypothetical protein